ncbi:hypothetical protein APHMUC_0010 [Anaplasma phagocytophilum str. ApMUC09]|uniref:Uncharacterized protein n=2 Tax=Anaplasma phagocytophilum TaxID=948 RepID=A0A0F3NES8_ANAPH|nr:hypothetical protein APHMUC_0010 [Anaplasma phagocytophilum str. ApMUC09]KJV66197.1 hypothetical protein EPHNCH_0628 [Anaplasma phagocytophilum str. NCH-1]
MYTVPSIIEVICRGRTLLLFVFKARSLTLSHLEALLLDI